MNGNSVYDRDEALFSYFGGAIRFFKPVVWSGMVCRQIGLVTTIIENQKHTFVFPSFWSPFILFTFITRMELKIFPPNNTTGGTLSVNYNHPHDGNNALLKSFNIPISQTYVTFSHLFLRIPNGTTSVSFVINKSRKGALARLFVDFVA